MPTQVATASKRVTKAKSSKPSAPLIKPCVHKVFKEVFAKGTKARKISQIAVLKEVCKARGETKSRFVHAVIKELVASEALIQERASFKKGPKFTAVLEPKVKKVKVVKAKAAKKKVAKKPKKTAAKKTTKKITKKVSKASSLKKKTTATKKKPAVKKTTAAKKPAKK